jgi:uncharacterized protein YndB with AHSA1/START domain
MGTRNKVYVIRKFHTSRQTLFNWIIRPDLISKWFGPKQVSVGKVESDFKIGGSFKIQLLKPDATSFLIEGTYFEIDEPNRIKFTFVYSELDNPPPPSIVTISFEEISPLLTELTLVQEFELEPSDFENRTKSWKYMFQILEREIKAVANNY